MTSTGAPESRTALRNALRTMGYEVMPFARARDAVLAHVPTSVPLTVTASPQKGIDATVELATALAADGYTVAPHLSARMITDRSRLADLLARCVEAGITRLFVVGGDGEPTGAYSDAVELLRDVHELGHRFADIGIGGYPEGHGVIADDALLDALTEKAPLVDHIVTQICFDPRTITRWAGLLADRGVTLPIRVGVPGAVSRQKLLRITAAVGVGDSARFLRRQNSLFWRFFVPGGYRPDKLVHTLQPQLAGESTITGFHVFTFNDVAGTEAWRQRMLQRLVDPSAS